MRTTKFLVLGVLASCVSKPDRRTALPAEPDAAPLDAAPDVAMPPDAPDLCVVDTCEAAGGECMNGTCVIERTTATFVTCPTGMPCQVECTGKDACKPGVSCGGATACAVLCDNDTACTDHGVDCATAATCDVTCTGSTACQHHVTSGMYAVECGSSDCRVTCTGQSACQDGIGGTTSGTCVGLCCMGACHGASTCTISTTCP
jgi:hypothetical protein